MKELYKRIADIVPFDNAKSPFEWLAYVVEEVGEVTRCISEEAGLKNKKATEHVLSEIADIIISTMALHKVLGGNFEELRNDMDRKHSRWEKRIAEKLKKNIEEERRNAPHYLNSFYREDRLPGTGSLGID